MTNSIFKPEKIEQEKIKNNTISYTDDDNSKYEHFLINSTNFYDADYFVPETEINNCIKKRLEHPLFFTQNKNVYPF